MDKVIHIHYLTMHSSDYPSILIDRLGADAPERLAYIGNIKNLSLPKIALFCSRDTPGNVILHTFDKVAEFRDKGCCIISGFHSPIEKECLKILMRGSQPVIICPARALEGMRIYADFMEAIEKDRLLILSPFYNFPKCITRESALLRNKIVAALCDEAFIGFAGKDSYTENIIGLLHSWDVRCYKPDV